MAPVVIDPNVRGREKFLLDDGRAIWLTRLEQWQTYSGLLEGHPGPDVNKTIVRLAISSARNWGGEGVELLLVPGQAKPTEFEALGGERMLTLEALPAITCIGEFEFDTPSVSSDETINMIAVWFQDGWGQPNEVTRDWLCKHVGK